MASPHHSRRMAATSINAALVARLQTFLSLLAFGSAFAIGCSLHYEKIVKNGVAGYPQEWLPSVSATIGDWYPERNVFQILIALTATPRFLILLLMYHLYRSTSLLIFGVLRTLSCGGWVYITSNDNSTVHDIMMIAYMLLNIPWMAGSVLMSESRGVRRARTVVAMTFFVTIIPLVYFYVQHKVHRIPGAYSSYAVFEWSLILFDILFDSILEKELRGTKTHIELGPQRSEQSSTKFKADGITNEYFGLRIPSVDNSTASIQINADKEIIREEAVKDLDDAMKGAPESALSAPSVDTKHLVASTLAEETISWRAPLSFVSDLYRSYVFWSLFTALIPTLFYFSIWELGIAGHELALLTLLTPLFLSTTPFFLPLNGVARPIIPTWYQMLTHRRGQSIGYLVQYAAMCVWVSSSPVVRLGVVALGCAVMVPREVVLWSALVKGEGAEDGRGVDYWSVVTVLGFVCAAGSKHVNHGNNPIWPFIDPKNGGWNRTGLILALSSLVEFSTRTSSKVAHQIDTRDSQGTATKVTRPSFLTMLITTSLPLGSLIFSLHNLLADPSTLVATSWTGWENGKPRGPLPHVFGVVTMVIMCLGIAIGVGLGLSSSYSPVKTVFSGTNELTTRSPIWWLIACAGALGMYKERNWEGFISGLALAFVLASVAPRVFESAARVARTAEGSGEEGVERKGGQVANVYASTMLVYILLNLASIFTVAYAFVPGGWVFRERTDSVLIAQLLCLAPAFSWPSLRALYSNVSTPTYQTRPTTISTKKYAYITLTLLSVISIFSTLLHLPLIPPRPFKQGATSYTVLNAGIWTVHFGFDNEGHDSQRGVREVLRDMELDVVGLLETDLHRTAFGHRDLTRVLVEDLGYNVDIGPGPNEHTWGAVLLSRYPIISTKHHLLPSPRGELAPAIEAVLDVHGVEITVIVAHNGQEEDKLDRELQSKELARIMAASPRPVIFLGYVVTKPHALRPNPYEIMVEDGNVHDIDQDDEDRWCEYIFYRGLYRTSYARLSRGIITDTELQIGQFVVPKLGTNITDDSHEARYIRTPKEALGAQHWFPMEYYGNEQGGGKNGHFYHVFYSPLYYLLPEGAVV